MKDDSDDLVIDQEKPGCWISEALHFCWKDKDFFFCIYLIIIDLMIASLEPCWAMLATGWFAFKCRFPFPLSFLAH